MRAWTMLVTLPLFGGCFGPDPCPRVVYGQPISVPVTDAVVTVRSRVSVHTNVDVDGVAVAIDDNIGSVTFPAEAPAPAFIFDASFLPGVQRNLYQGLSVSDGAWRPFWLYCSADGRLTNFWGERTNRTTPTITNAAGPCLATDGPYDLHVQIPAHELTNVELTCGFSMKDPNPAYKGADFARLSVEASKPGTWWRDNQMATVLVFAGVDCSDGCGEGGSWYELHSLIWETAPPRLGFGVWYVHLDSPTTPLHVAAGMFLPDLVPISDVLPDASWTIDWQSAPPSANDASPPLQPALPVGLGLAGDKMPAVAQLPVPNSGLAFPVPSGNDTDHPKIVASPGPDGRVVVFIHDSTDFLVTYQRDSGHLSETGNRLAVGGDQFLALAMDNTGDLYTATANGTILVRRFHWDGANWVPTQVGGQANSGAPAITSFSGVSPPLGTTTGGQTAFTHSEPTPGLAVINFDPTSDPIVYLAVETGDVDHRQIAISAANGNDLRNGKWKGTQIIAAQTSSGSAFHPNLSGDGSSNILDVTFFDREPAAGGGAGLAANELRTGFARFDASRFSLLYRQVLNNSAPLVSDLPARSSVRDAPMQLFTGEYMGVGTKGTTAIAAWPERPQGATGNAAADLGLASLGDNSDCTAALSGALLVEPNDTWVCNCQCGSTVVSTLGCASSSIGACERICAAPTCGQALSCVPSVCTALELGFRLTSQTCALSDGPIGGAPVASNSDFVAATTSTSSAVINLNGATATTPMTGNVFVNSSTSPPRAGSALEIARLDLRPADVFLGGSINANIQNMVITHHARIRGVFTDASHFRIDPGAARLILTASTQVSEDPPSAPFNLAASNSAAVTGTLDLTAGTISLDTTTSDGAGNSLQVQFRGSITSRPPDSDHDGIIDAVDKCPGTTPGPDRAPPVFTSVPPPITITRCTNVNIGQAQATDACGVTITNDAPARFPLGPTIVRWTARDGAGNTAVASQIVTALLGDDVSCCPTGSHIMVGTSNNDVLTGTAGSDCILGLGGQDRITGGAGDDFISGGDGDDNISGNDGNDRLYGGSGQDLISGGNGNDTISGGDGVDQLNGDDGDDQIFGGQGGDIIRGGAGNDRLFGDDDDDQIFGGDGDDFLAGGPANDRLFGENGNDILLGNDGDDNLDGGTGQNHLDGGDGHNQCVDNGVPLTCAVGDDD